jgi:DNA-binding PucR family transcriptional regulator
VVAYEDLGAWRLLARLGTPDTLREFAEETLGALVAYDRRHSGWLVETLDAYFRAQASPAQVARTLGVHVNTVGYRLRRIEEITGLDLGNARDRLAGQLAVEILEALGPP